jgi:hypothetical protein
LDKLITQLEKIMAKAVQKNGTGAPEKLDET